LVRAGHDVLLFATGDSTCAVPTTWVLPEAVGVGTAGSATELRHVVHAYEAILDWGPDVVHDHTLVGPVYADRFDELSVVTTNHGPFESELGDYYRAIADQVPIVAISQHQASTARGIRIARVIHHGVDTDRFRPGPGTGGYALFLGRTCPEKGVRRAITVARKAGIPLKIAAKAREPHEIAYFRSEIAPLLGRDVEFVGEVGGNDKIALLADAHCLLNPIDWPEPFGMVMIEALACGTPVIATPRGSVPELIDDGLTGFIRATEADLAAALHAATQLRRDDCRAAALERFSIDRMTADHERLYHQVGASCTPAIRVA